MAFLKFLLTLLAVSSITFILAKPGGYSTGKDFGMPYQFQWYVNQPDYGNDYGHKEHSDGNVVQGQYYVLLPDGRRQTVTYTADHESGFVADVKYEGGVGGGGGYH